MSKLLELKNQNLLLLNYLESISGESLADFEDTIRIGYEKNDFKGLGITLKDNIQWVKDFFQNDNEEVEAILSRNAKGPIQKVADIIEKGRIENITEYEFIKDFVDENWNDMEFSENKINILNSLLNDFLC